MNFVTQRSLSQSIARGNSRTPPFQSLFRGREANPGTVCIVAATINKWLSCLGAVLNWARKNGLIPDDVAWSDPAAGMRLPEAHSQRQPWEPEELSLLFGSPIYLLGERPAAGKGEAAYWLPLLALFSGARLNELAPMRAEDIKHDTASDVHFMTVIEDDVAGRSVKTETSLRAVPIHPELKRIGFLKFVDHRRQTDGPQARLFPLIQPNSKGNRTSLRQSSSCERKLPMILLAHRALRTIQ